MSDTSTGAVERFTYSLYRLAQYKDLPDVDKKVYGEAITLILALTAERDVLRAALERLDNLSAHDAAIVAAALNAKTPPG